MTNLIGINSGIPPIQSMPNSNPSHVSNMNGNGINIPGLGNKNITNLNSGLNNKNGNNQTIPNVMFYQNLNNNFIPYNGGNNIPINPMIYNGNNINNYQNIYQQYEYQNYFGNFYPNNPNIKLLANNGSTSEKNIRYNINQN